MLETFPSTNFHLDLQYEFYSIKTYSATFNVTQSRMVCVNTGIQNIPTAPPQTSTTHCFGPREPANPFRHGDDLEQDQWDAVPTPTP